MNIEFIHKRVALYIRVSTEEQALHGYSLEAQKETLTRFAKDNDMKIIDYYIDEGVSARKKYTTRKEFMRMLDDVKQNRIDIILFIKLDRWFRSVKDYYKIQDILEEHKVSWKAVLEDYDTATANGRLHINIKLSIAQDESDRTSERIKYVFENKVKKGEVITGSFPLGYKIENKRLVIDTEKVEIVRAIFNKFATTHAIRTTNNYIRDNFNTNLCDTTVKRILQNKLYIGEYREVKDFCPAIIDKDLFNDIQLNLTRTVKAESKYTYLFSSMVYCALCNHSMSGGSVSVKKYRYYVCSLAKSRKLCKYFSVSEKYLEKYLIDNIYTLAKSTSITSKLDNVSKEKTIDKSSIKKKLNKLKELYLNDLISLDEYKKDYKKYNDLLDTNPKSDNSSNKNLSSTIDFFSDKSWVNTYSKLSNNYKRIFWRKFISKIFVDDKKNITVEFI